MNKNNIYLAGLAALTLSACKPHLDTDAPDAGTLNLRTYVAVGNSLTAGFADGTLYRSGQENSYPLILAKQFSSVGGGEFRTPFLPETKGYPGARRVLGYTTSCLGVTSLGPVLEDTVGQSASNAANAQSIASAGPYNNTGVPGIRAIDYLFPGYPSVNPYSKRFFLNPAASALQEINRANATFFTAWIGNNDVLGYATSGGAGKGSGGVGELNAISSVALFSTAVDSVLNRMTAAGAKGAVINIPDVTAIPYFTTVPINGLTLRAGQADSLNAAYAGTGVRFAEGANNFVIQDTSVAGIGFRQLRAGEYLILTLPQDSIRCGGWGSRKPIPAQYVLDAREVDNVRVATTAFNNILQQAATTRGLAFVDMNSYLKTVQAGITFNAVAFNAVFVTGGAFSLDGIHLTPRGYALIANQILRTVNQYYSAAIPLADVNSYPGVRFP